MKANELRIGNLVFDRRKEIIEVGPVLLTQLILWQDTHYSRKPPCDPIPLTEEWLLKFGFGGKDPFTYLHIKTNELEFHWGNNNLNVISYDLGAGITFNVQYIHQLQNLYFALTGEELTIN